MNAWLALALASVSTSRTLADGELDLGFSPPPELTNSSGALSVVLEQAYVYSYTLPVRRLRDDGSFDPEWEVGGLAGAHVNDVCALAAGGLAVNSSVGVVFDHGDGTYTKSNPVSLGLPFADRLLPQDDGSVSVWNGRAITKVRADGSIDRDFRIYPSLRGVGNVFVTEADSHRRRILIGSFQTPAPTERLGLLRLLADGTVDPNWNPAPDLDPDPQNAVGFAATMLRDDSVLLVLQDELVWIDAQGKITKRVPNLANFKIRFGPPVVQPDGKVIVSGYFFKWGEATVSGPIRLNVDGTLDNSFSVQLDAPSLETMVLDAHGRLWLNGAFRIVNGVPRPGVARIFAFTPNPTNSVVPTTTVSVAQSHISTDEVLFLTAWVDGIPTPDLQWFRNGAPLVGATNRGIRLTVTNNSNVGNFSLVASNSLGSQTLEFPPVSLAMRSPHPGTEDLAFNRALTNFIYVTHLVPLTDGRILVGSGNPFSNDTSETALVGRLLPDGTLDTSFGEEGIVRGEGHVETVVPLSSGGLLVTGDFTSLAGQPVQGLAELDHTGKLVPRPFPSLDVIHVSTALPLPDGRLMIAGRFTKVGNIAAFRLARLNADLTADSTFHSPVESPRFVDALALDLQGRLLVAGERTYGTNDQVLTNPPSLGLIRLLNDGAFDPAFHAVPPGVGTIYVEPDGRLLVGMPGLRLEEDGTVVTVFEEPHFPYTLSNEELFPGFQPKHVMVRTSDGGIICRAVNNLSLDGKIEVVRWKPTGEFDLNYKCALNVVFAVTSKVTAMARLADDSILLTTFGYDSATSPIPPEIRYRLRLIPRDSDASLKVKGLSAGQFHVALETQPGLTYEIYRREQLTGGTATKIGEYPGDGYVIDLETPATGDATYLELRRH